MRKLIFAAMIAAAAMASAATFGSLDTDAGTYAADFKVAFTSRPIQVSLYASGGTVTYSGWRLLGSNWQRVIPADSAGDTVVTIFDGGVINESSVNCDVLVVHRGSARAVIYWQ